jgi:hypothetical protein
MFMLNAKFEKFWRARAEFSAALDLGGSYFWQHFKQFWT